MNTICIIAAHLASTRYPRKVLANIEGKSMLQRVVERVQCVSLIDRIVIALDADEPDLLNTCLAFGYATCVGHHRSKDVLSLIYDTARVYKANHIVRITSDCPVIDPAIITQVIQRYQKTFPDYCSNIFPNRTFFDGCDVEVFPLRILGEAAAKTISPRDREHVTPWIHHAPRLTIDAITQREDQSQIRLTVDTPEDMPVIRYLYQQCQEPFGTAEIMEALKTWEKPSPSLPRS
jgi:spore coat polysaccharide biosynthesis protein SpsF (cytidylyltransferase family)